MAQDGLIPTVLGYFQEPVGQVTFKLSVTRFSPPEEERAG